MPKTHTSVSQSMSKYMRVWISFLYI